MKYDIKLYFHFPKVCLIRRRRGGGACHIQELTLTWEERALSCPGVQTRGGGDSISLETFMAVVQRTGAGSKPLIPCVVSKSDRDHGTATTDNRNLGLTPAVTISRSNLSLSLYPILLPRMCGLGTWVCTHTGIQF